MDHISEVALYILTHNQTGLKYFGKTTKHFTEKDIVEKYGGSGVKWRKHLDEHGYDISAKIYWKGSKDHVKDIALNFSKEHNIVNSDDWANLCEETGLDIWDSPKSHIWKESISISMKGNKNALGHKRTYENSAMGGKVHKKVSKKKISESLKGNQNAKGTPKQIRCPHCEKEGGANTMKRWHFDNCKSLKG
tara:strand:+ start:128 stop:703 length:576 start_codon:yes stop_codon:yes gene_type:complete